MNKANWFDSKRKEIEIPSSFDDAGKEYCRMLITTINRLREENEILRQGEFSIDRSSNGNHGTFVDTSQSK